MLAINTDYAFNQRISVTENAAYIQFSLKKNQRYTEENLCAILFYGLRNDYKNQTSIFVWLGW